MPEIKAIEWEAGKLKLLDQTALPLETNYIELESYAEVIDAIRRMKVRGAPAIGVAAAYAMAMAARDANATDKASFLEALRVASHRIGQARPTAVNITWGVERMLRLAKRIDDVGQAPDMLLEEAHRVQHEDEEANRRIGSEGKGLIPKGGVGAYPLQHRGPGNGRLRYSSGGDPGKLGRREPVPSIRYRDSALPAGSASF